MRIALIGYGKMGKAIDALAPEQGVEVVARLGRNWKLSEIAEADVCIEFTTPTSALGNIERVLSAKKPLVIGTTGRMATTDAARRAEERLRIPVNAQTCTPDQWRDPQNWALLIEIQQRPYVSVYPQ